MRPQDILMPVPAGLCCKPGGFHIDPVRPVERAVITHGHSDHARPGHGAVLATQETLDMMRLRYGDNFARSTQAIAYGEELRLGDVTIKFHPAGHVLGSAQIPASSRQAITRTHPTPPARRSRWCRATSSSPKRPLACRCSATATRRMR
jgi:putative mRNA 3-end processing factor